MIIQKVIKPTVILGKVYLPGTFYLNYIFTPKLLPNIVLGCHFHTLQVDFDENRAFTWKKMEELRIYTWSCGGYRCKYKNVMIGEGYNTGIAITGEDLEYTYRNDLFYPTNYFLNKKDAIDVYSAKF